MALVRSTGTRITVTAGPQVSPNATWMYFKGNGHTVGRNGPYDHVNVQRYFYIPTVEDGVDTLAWHNGFSLCWQYLPVRQAAYYTTFFYSASQGTDFYDLLGGSGYVGCHPYPYAAFGNGDGDDFRLHKWEISVDGGDAVSAPVDYGQVHTQAFRCEVVDQASGESRLRFYPAISGAGATANEVTHAGGYAYAAPHPSKAVVFGNAPWWAAHQHERLSGFIRRIKIFAGDLSDADLLAEAQADTLVTASGQERIWWGKINPQTPDDLASDFLSSGSIRRTAQWIDPARCDIVAQADLAAHHAVLSAATIGNTLHMERGG